MKFIWKVEICRRVRRILRSIRIGLCSTNLKRLLCREKLRGWNRKVVIEVRSIKEGRKPKPELSGWSPKIAELLKISGTTSSSWMKHIRIYKRLNRNKARLKADLLNYSPRSMNFKRGLMNTSHKTECFAPKNQNLPGKKKISRGSSATWNKTCSDQMPVLLTIQRFNVSLENLSSCKSI